MTRGVVDASDGLPQEDDEENGNSSNSYSGVSSEPLQKQEPLLFNPTKLACLSSINDLVRRRIILKKISSSDAE